MELILERDRKNVRANCTIGMLFNSDGEYLCDTLEDKEREVKIYGKTAIPCGRYELRWSFSPKFKRYLPEIINVPNYTGVRIHSGNTHEDTHGCQLVGKYDGADTVLRSVDAFERVKEQLRNATHITVV